MELAHTEGVPDSNWADMTVEGNAHSTYIPKAVVVKAQLTFASSARARLYTLRQKIFCTYHDVLDRRGTRAHSIKNIQPCMTHFACAKVATASWSGSCFFLSWLGNSSSAKGIQEVFPEVWPRLLNVRRLQMAMTHTDRYLILSCLPPKKNRVERYSNWREKKDTSERTPIGTKIGLFRKLKFRLCNAPMPRRRKA